MPGIAAQASLTWKEGRGHPLVRELRRRLREAADPVKAAPMRAYMKTDQPFYGVPAPVRRAQFRDAIRRHPVTSRQEYVQVVRALWTGTHREEMYQALEVAEHGHPWRDGESWPLYAELVASASNWDTLDWIAGKLAGGVVLKERRFEAELEQWSRSAHLWTRRASLLAHLNHREQTNTVLLSETILRLAAEKEFFIRKAIGWVLRQYARTNPGWVCDFVKAHEGRLSPLSRREAMKHLNP